MHYGAVALGVELDDDVAPARQDLRYAALATELADLQDAAVHALQQCQVVADAAAAAKVRLLTVVRPTTTEKTLPMAVVVVVTVVVVVLVVVMVTVVQRRVHVFRRGPATRKFIANYI